MTRGQVLEILETTLDEVVKNPEWIKELAEDESPILGNIVSSTQLNKHDDPSLQESIKNWTGLSV